MSDSGLLKKWKWEEKQYSKTPNHDQEMIAFAKYYHQNQVQKALEGMEEDKEDLVLKEADKYSDEIAQGFIKGNDWTLEEIRKRLT